MEQSSRDRVEVLLQSCKWVKESTLLAWRRIETVPALSISPARGKYGREWMLKQISAFKSYRRPGADLICFPGWTDGA